MDEEVNFQVECHSGYEYAERPAALTVGGKRMEVVAVEDTWRIPGGKCFRVRLEDGRKFELFYGEMYDEWRVHEI